MQFGYIILYVKDVLASVDFYKKAFGLKLRFLHESEAYAEMETGQTAVAFVNEEMMKGTQAFRENRLTQDPAGIEIVFVSENVEESFDKAVKAGASSVAKPEEKPWGQLVSYVRDCNGCLIEICSPMAK